MHVTLHSLSSVDGRIQGKRWGLPDPARYFEGPASKIKVDAWIVGRTTMQEFCSKRKHRLGPPDRSIEKTDFVGRHQTKSHAVAIDPFLKTGLIDEISHIVAPIADGSMQTPTRFDAESGVTRRRAQKLKLKSITKLPGGVLWARYTVPGSGSRLKV